MENWKVEAALERDGNAADLVLRIGTEQAPKLINVRFCNPVVEDWQLLCSALENGDDYEISLEPSNGYLNAGARQQTIYFEQARYGSGEDGDLNNTLPRAGLAPVLAQALRKVF